MKKQHPAKSKISLVDFQRKMSNGSLGYLYDVRTAMTYKCGIKKVIGIYGGSQNEFFSLLPEEFSALTELIFESECGNLNCSEKTYRVMCSAMHCYGKYLSLMHPDCKPYVKKGNVPFSDTSEKRRPSLLWRILNFFGLLKYVTA